MLAFTRNWNFQRGKELRETESSYFLGATGSCTVTAGIRGQHNVSGAGSFCDSEWANTNKNKQTNKKNVHRAHLTADVIHMRSGVEPQQQLLDDRAGNPPREKFLGNPSNFRLYQRTGLVHNNENNRSFVKRYKKSHTLRNQTVFIIDTVYVCICIYWFMCYKW